MRHHLKALAIVVASFATYAHAEWDLKNETVVEQSGFKKIFQRSCAYGDNSYGKSAKLCFVKWKTPNHFDWFETDVFLYNNEDERCVTATEYGEYLDYVITVDDWIYEVSENWANMYEKELNRLTGVKGYGGEIHTWRWHNILSEKDQFTVSYTDTCGQNIEVKINIAGSPKIK